MNVFPLLPLGGPDSADGSDRSTPFLPPGVTPLAALLWSSPMFGRAILSRHRGQWMIRKKSSPDAPSRAGSPVFLQIASGRWCHQAAATKFPTRAGAANYAAEFGLTLGEDVELVRPIGLAA